MYPGLILVYFVENLYQQFHRTQDLLVVPQGASSSRTLGALVDTSHWLKGVTVMIFHPIYIES
jgi:hypothetical protein